MRQINKDGKWYESVLTILAGIGGIAAGELVRVLTNAALDQFGIGGAQRTFLDIGKYGLESAVVIETSQHLMEDLDMAVDGYNDMCNEVNKYKQFKEAEPKPSGK